MRRFVMVLLFSFIVFVVLSACGQSEGAGTDESGETTSSEEKGSNDGETKELTLGQTDIQTQSIGEVNNRTHFVSQEGQLWSFIGDDPSTFSQVPLDKKITSISSGLWGHALALAEDGTVFSTGNNEYGELGNGTLLAEREFVSVPVLKDIVYVTDAVDQSFALDKKGNVYRWGNDYMNGPIKEPVKEKRLKNIVSMSSFRTDVLFLDSKGSLIHMYLDRFSKEGPAMKEVEDAPKDLVYIFPGATEFRKDYSNQTFFFAKDKKGEFYYIAIEKKDSTSQYHEAVFSFTKLEELKNAKFVVPTEMVVDEYMDFSGGMVAYYSSDLYFKAVLEDGSIGTIKITPDANSYKFTSSGKGAVELAQLFYGDYFATGISTDGTMLVSDEIEVLMTDSQTNTLINIQVQKDVLPTHVLGKESKSVQVVNEKQPSKKVEEEKKPEREPSETNQSASDSESQSNKEIYLGKLAEIESKVKVNTNGVTFDIISDSSYNLEMWDAALNEIYGVLNEVLPQSEMNKLRDEQRQWIVDRDQAAQEKYDQEGGGSLSRVVYSITIEEWTKERCYELVNKYMK